MGSVSNFRRQDQILFYRAVIILSWNTSFTTSNLVFFPIDLNVLSSFEFLPIC